MQIGRYSHTRTSDRRSVRVCISLSGLSRHREHCSAQDVNRSMSAIYCSICGTQNPMGALFCSACGARLAGQVPVSTPSAQTLAPTSVTPSRQDAVQRVRPFLQIQVVDRLTQGRPVWHTLASIGSAAAVFAPNGSIAPFRATVENHTERTRADPAQPHTFQVCNSEWYGELGQEYLFVWNFISQGTHSGPHNNIMYHFFTLKAKGFRQFDYSKSFEGTLLFSRLENLEPPLRRLWFLESFPQCSFPADFTLEFGTVREMLRSQPVRRYN
jgi:hypothetical protein